MKRLLPYFLLLLTLPLQADTTSIRFSDGWIKQLPPVVPMRAGYVTISNPSKQAHEIIAFQSESFERVEMHESQLDDEGVLRMVQLESIVLPAESSVELRPGGKHLMLVSPLNDLQTGDRVNLTVTFQDGSAQRLEFEVKR